MSARVPAVVAFSGKYGTGKDSAAAAVIEHVRQLEYKVVHLKFADALKKSCAIMTGLSLEDQYSEAGKCKLIPGLDMTVARFQQLHGTVARQHLHPNVWVIPVINVCRQSTHGIVYVISDCRFPNELDAIHAIGGVVIRLNRPAHLISQVSKAGRDPMHVSETALDDCTAFDLVIENDGVEYEHLEKVIRYLFN